MLAKLALRNVGRAWRDYAIYFITVTLGVALFYAFNAIHSQAVLFDALSTDSLNMLALLNMLIGLFSVVVACVLGFLVVYANRFLIRRRRREFGTYLLLGMSAGRVSRVLLYETFLVGLVSLATGLAIGIALSQGLSFATAALMGTTMSKYRFIVSGEAIGLTALCFVAIFVLSALVDVVYIRRCKLVVLLSTREANERGDVASIPARAAGFLLALGILACAYWQLVINGMMQADMHFWAATILMVVGTFLFFWSVSGFAVFVLTHATSIYLRGIRMVTLRQIASKINTAFASMAVVCVMLFFALTTASVGMGLLELFAGNIEQTTRYDASIMASPAFFDESDDAWKDEWRSFDGDMTACLASRTDRWAQVAQASAQLDYWPTELTYQTLLDQVPDALASITSDTYRLMCPTALTVLGASQYNATCALIGERGIALADDEFAVDNTVVGYDVLGEALCNANVRIKVADVSLHGQGALQRVPLDTSAMSDASLVVVVPDAVVARLRQTAGLPTESYLNVMYRTDRAQGDAALAAALAEAQPLADGLGPVTDSMDDQFRKRPWPVTNAYTGRGMADQASGLRMVIAFLALYIGFVMLVATAAVLAIQQLSETTDSLQRYRRLSDLGCDPRQIFGSLRSQTVVYFCAPLALAMCHTLCAVLVVSSTLFSQLGVDPTRLIVVAAGSIVGVYAIYLVATYLLSRSIVRGALAWHRRS